MTHADQIRCAFTQQCRIAWVLEQVNYTHAMRFYDPELQMMHQVIDE